MKLTPPDPEASSATPGPARLRGGSALPARRVLAPWAWVERNDGGVGGRLVRDAAFDLDGDGRILQVGHAESPLAPVEGRWPVESAGRTVLVPGLVDAHSHAFQRAIRGRTQRRGSGDPSSFWSWRSAMYEAADRLDPEGVYTVSRATFREMLEAGITCVGEFHYLHHQPGGRPYEDPNELGHAVIRAAREVGLRITLLDVLYQSSGPGEAPLPEQRRFCDANTDSYLERVDALARSYADDPGVRIACAPHSVRAVTPEALRQVAEWTATEDRVVHVHVSEQRRENEICQAAYGRSPTQLLADAGLLDRNRRFTAVHAIHLDASDRELLGHQFVCACPSTEADLGDGVVEADRLRDAGAEICLGSDSHARVDLLSEASALEMHLRLIREARLVLADTEGAVAPVLADAATRHGARALGWGELGRLAPDAPFDACGLDLDHPHLRGLSGPDAFDAAWTSGRAELAQRVWVDGRRLR